MFHKAITCFPILFLIENIIYVSATEYVVSTDKTNFYQAFLNCQQDGMRLATIKSPNDQDRLNTYLENRDHEVAFWLGATNLINNKDYYWLTTGEPVKYTAWLDSEPNNYSGVENCLQWKRVSHSKGWNDANCNREFKYICEKDWQKKEYVTFYEKVNFFQAFLNCQNANMSLATIKSHEDEASLNKHLKDTDAEFKKGYWLGATNLHDKTSKDYYWLTTGELATYTNWIGNNPDNYKGVENCLEFVLRDGIKGWNDVNCNNKLNYVCETNPV